MMLPVGIILLILAALCFVNSRTNDPDNNDMTTVFAVVFAITGALSIAVHFI